MKPITIALVLAALTGAAQAQPASATGERQARCKLLVGEKTYISGACTFRPQSGDGSFIITAKDGKYFAYVNQTPEGMHGFWNEEAFADHAHTNLGILRRDGACWKNEQAQICAWQ